MSRRSSLRLSVRAFVFSSGIGLWVACSSDSTDFFGPPLPGAGKGAQAGSGTASGGSAGSGAGLGGAGAATTGGTHTGGSTAGTDPSAGSGNPSGGAPDAGAPSSGGAGGKGGAGGTGGSSVGGAGLASGTGGEGGDIGSAGTQAGDGGNSGEPSVGGTAGSGTGGAGMGGTAGGGMGGIAGIAGVAGSGGSPPLTCGGDGDCAPSEYCKKASCDATTGTCTVRPVSCTSGADAEFNPVCGCDQMTYYTKCVAAREGVNVASTGECSTGSPCTRTGGSGDSCMPHRNRAACYRTRANCGGTAPNEGVCWVLPDVCPQEDAAHLYCNQGGTPECHGLCDALESKYPLVMNSNQCN